MFLSAFKFESKQNIVTLFHQSLTSVSLHTEQRLTKKHTYWASAKKICFEMTREQVHPKVIYGAE